MKIINKKALHNYHILEHFEAGIVLSGSEVKSIRAGRIDLGESHIRVLNGEAFIIRLLIKNMMPKNPGSCCFTGTRLIL